MVNTPHASHIGNHDDHHCSVKNTAAALWNTKIPRRFKTKWMLSPIKPMKSNGLCFFIVFGLAVKASESQNHMTV